MRTYPKPPLRRVIHGICGLVVGFFSGLLLGLEFSDVGLSDPTSHPTDGWPWNLAGAICAASTLLWGVLAALYLDRFWDWWIDS